MNRARMEGIVVFDYADRYHMAIAEMAGYMQDGRMKSKEDVVVGLQTFPETLFKLFKLFNGKRFRQAGAESGQGLRQVLPGYRVVRYCFDSGLRIYHEG